MAKAKFKVTCVAVYVSIPHRYSTTNMEKINEVIKILNVSIPHRYSTTRKQYGKDVTSLNVSIPHRYSTTNT